MFQKIKITIYSLLVITALSCTENTPVAPTKQKDITVLLDLSDRIINQKERDIIIIDSIYSGFINFQKNRFIENDNDVEGLNDRFQVKIAYQANNPADIRNQFEDKLVVNTLSSSENRLKNYFNEDVPNFYKNIQLLYDKVDCGNDCNKYFGADIFKYFNEELKVADLDSNSVYKIVILTDGYMFVKDKQGEDIPLQNIAPLNKFSNKNIEVILVEIEPKENLEGEFNRMDIGWTEWFKKMGIKANVIKKNKLGKTIEKLQTFLGFSLSYMNNIPSNENVKNESDNPVGKKDSIAPIKKETDIKETVTNEKKEQQPNNLNNLSSGKKEAPTRKKNKNETNIDYTRMDKESKSR